MPKASPVFHLNFHPEGWSELERFRKLNAQSYNLDWRGNHAVDGIVGHLQRSETLLNLAHTQASLIEEDRVELDEKGYSKATRSKEVAAIIESIILGIYSAIDCTMEVLYRIYKNRKGVCQSTSGLFDRARKGLLDERIPIEIVRAFSESTWYDELERVRTEITHYNVGFCYWDKEVGKIGYMHHGLGKIGGKEVINDIFLLIGEWISGVVEFINRITRELNLLAQNREVQQMCGLYEGRVYMRSVQTHEAKTFHDGVCLAHTWFEQENNPKCPLASQCGAYGRAKSIPALPAQ